MVKYVFKKVVLCRVLMMGLCSILISGTVAFTQAAEGRSSVIMPLAYRSLLLDVAFAGPARLVAVGERGHILISDDKGKTWQQVVTPTQSTLTSVFFLDEKNGWVAGHDTVILVTKDGGKTWNKQFYDPAKGQPIMDICFKDFSLGIAIGAYGLYLETRDGGTTWQEKYFESLDDPDFGLVHFNAITISDDGMFFMAGEAGFLARSYDSGETWEPLERIYPGSYFTALATQKGSIIIGGLRGNAFRSTDKGDTWERIETNTLAILNDCVQAKDGSIVISGLGSTLLISNDDGESYIPIKRPDRISIAATAILEKGVLVIVGEGGVRQLTY
ncbi:MAG: hypothetical protein KJ737_19125 [Proteobacteria bacterium]|nr:hypothetical protein [Pseudomonadota bacterium]